MFASRQQIAIVLTGFLAHPLSTYRSSSWARCQLRPCGRWCPPPRSGSARYCGSHCHGNQTPGPTPGPAGESEKDRQKVRKVNTMTTKMLRASCRLKANDIIRLQNHHQSPQRGRLGRVWAHRVFSWNDHIRDQHFESSSCLHKIHHLYISISVLGFFGKDVFKPFSPQLASSFCQHCWSAASLAAAALCWQEAWNRQLG